MSSSRIHQVFLLLLWIILVQGRAQNRNIKLVAMSGNQYWFSSSSPYAPTLNFHLAYQYCRTLGLQLATLETKEEVDLIASYLKSVEGNSPKEYWTSGNKLGSDDSWIWMSSGEQLNSTFSDYWLQQKLQSTSGPAKDCMTMQTSPLTKRTLFSPEECGRPLTFICEQLRCLYYNYPVTPFPDPEAAAEIAALRADLDASSSSPSESRSFPHLFDEDALRIRNYLLQTSSSSSGKNKTFDHNLPYALRRRLTTRPITDFDLPTTTKVAATATPSSSPVISEPREISSSKSPSHHQSSTLGTPPPITTIKYGVVKSTTKDQWTPSTTTDLNYVTVKNVVVSKSEKVSYSSNYSNIHGVPHHQQQQHQKTFHLQQQNRQKQQPGGGHGQDFVVGIPVDSSSDFANYRTDALTQQQHEATETVFYDDLGHTENYHFDDATEIFQEQETRSSSGSNINNNHNKNENDKEPPIAVKMFQFHRSRTPVSWSRP